MMMVVPIGVLPHAGYQNVSPGLGEYVGKFFFVVDCISGHFMKIWILVIFSIFFHQFQQMLIVGLLRCGWIIWGPQMVILNVWVQFNLYLNHFEQLERNISSKRLWPHTYKLHPNCKNRVHPLKGEDRLNDMDW